MSESLIQKSSSVFTDGIKRTTCPICTKRCVVDARIENGKIVKIEKCKDTDFETPPICMMAKAVPEYVHHPDRIKTPLKRRGNRGDGDFVPISWEEAYSEIGEKLNGFKEQNGADSVLFFTGWEKWYRHMLHRLAYSFGSVNYGTESSSCFLSLVTANKIASGYNNVPDYKNAGVIIFWSLSDLLPFPVEKVKDLGVKIIVVDPQLSNRTRKYADIHLRLLPGTDGALAHGLARFLIHQGAIDKEYIGKHVHGFEEYRAYVEQFDLDTTASVTGLSPEEIQQAARLIIDNPPFTQREGNTGMIHHTNGLQGFRALNALTAITGSFDARGGQTPAGSAFVHSFLPEGVMDLEFVDEKIPLGGKPMIGSDRFPLWTELNDEMQAMRMTEQILTGEPYPVRALVGFGFNIRMFPDSSRLFEAVKKLDFYVDVDLFMTDSARYADIVLPAAPSPERHEMLGLGSSLFYFKPAIPPFHEAQSDMDIICGLAKALEVEDPLLISGYEACCSYIIRDLPLTFEELSDSDKPLPIPPPKKRDYRELSEEGYDTPTGKYELYSTIIDKHPEWNLDALPVYHSSLDSASPEDFPLILSTGIRYPYMVHSRTHRIPSLRELRPDPMADINPEDASRLGIEQGDSVVLETQAGSLTVKANITDRYREGVVGMHHGYSDADVNTIVPPGHNDPYSGFPGFKSVRCRVRKG